MYQGNITRASETARAVVDEAEADADLTMALFGLVAYCATLALQGNAVATHAAAQSALATAEGMGRISLDTVFAGFAYAALAAGDASAARRAAEEAMRHTSREAFAKAVNPMAEAELACGDLTAARRSADEAIALVPGWYRMVSLTVRALVGLAQGDREQAERDAHEALTVAARTGGYARVADTLECLARMAADEGSRSYAARLLAAADAMRQRMGHGRFPMYQAGYDAALSAVREALGDGDFDTAWSEGAGLSTEEAIAYAQRGRGERKRPTSGWASLTPAERDVVRLVSEGLGNNDIATRLFVSPRTVQSHLTHVYAKLGLTSRVQLVQEAAGHN
jgi:DNA-binding CsgD family transcriptional regulator